MDTDKWRWPIFGCKEGQNVQIGMILELDMWLYLLDAYTKFHTDISKHVQKSPENFSLAGSSTNAPFKCFCPAEGQKLPNHDEISTNQDTHNMSVYTKSEFYMILKAMNADKWLWPIFGCKH